MRSKIPIPYKRKKQKEWSFYFYDANGDRVYRKTKIRSKTRALEFAIDYMDEYLGQKPPPTLEEYAKDFFVPGKCSWLMLKRLATKNLSDESIKLYRSKLVNHILPKFGRYRIDDDSLNAVDIQKWLAELPLKNMTRNHIKITFKIVLDHALRQKLMKGENVVDQVIQFGDDSTERLPFTIEECRTLFPSDDQELLRIWKTYFWASLFHTMLTTGLRSGEARALLWKDIFWGDCIVINKSIKNNSVIGETKGKKNRAVWLHPDTEDLLKKYRARYGFLVDDASVWFSLHKWTEHLSGRTLPSNLRKAMKRAGVDDRGQTPHSFRHTFNNEARKQLTGEALRYMIGHESIKMTDHYTHGEARERLLEYQDSRNAFDGLWNRR